MPEMKPGRRLRLDRRKAGLSQEGLARKLGTTKEAVSEMERDIVPLTPEAQAFVSTPPHRVPVAPTAPPAAEEVTPLPPAEEPGDGPGPRPSGDAAPRPRPAPPAPVARQSEIAELERALLTFFAGEEFLIPREQPDGTVTQVAAVIPGIAQVVGMVDEFDGMIIRTYAPGMARAWSQLAAQNETLRKVLMGLTYGGAYRGVIAATLPPAIAIMAHHGLLPGAGQEQPEPPPSDGSGTNGSYADGPPGFVFDASRGGWVEGEPPPIS